jgi:hypothetical protein
MAGCTPPRRSILRSIGPWHREVPTGQLQNQESLEAALPLRAIGSCSYCRAGAGTAAPPQRKTASEQLVDQQELLPMRLARVRAGIRRRVVWSLALRRAWKDPRPIRPSPDTPDGYRNRDPRKGHYENIRQRNPSAATNKTKPHGRPSEIEQPAPASTLLLPPIRLPPCRLQQRAGW